jgi:hypothetical protein
VESLGDVLGDVVGSPLGIALQVAFLAGLVVLEGWVALGSLGERRSREGKAPLPKAEVSARCGETPPQRLRLG